MHCTLIAFLQSVKQYIQCHGMMLSTLVSIFLLMFAGYVARRAGALRESDAGVIRSIVTNVTGPAFIFASIYGKPVNRDMMISPIIHILSIAVTIGAAYLIARLLKLNRATTGALMLVSAFGNTGFLGYPVVDAAYPGDSFAKAAVVMIDQLGETICMYSIGIAIALAFGSSKGRGMREALGFLKAPLFIAMMLVFAMRLPYLNQIHIPKFILVTNDPTSNGVINYLANATIPLAMLSLGLTMRRIPIKAVLLPFVFACVLKFVLMPVLNYVGLQVVGIHGTVYQIAMLESAMPAAIMTSVVAGRYGSDSRFASASVFLMTLMSMLIIPLVLAIFR